ncbi:PaaI family thioesterase [Staphylococcus chromogenes]|nr:PaaI family thioesterase [Staphylococcus chromogenes]
MNLAELLALAHQRPLVDAELAELNQAATGLSQHLGIRLTYVAVDKAEAQLDIAACHLQPFGLVNGGVYCSIGETLGSLAGAVAAGKPVVGVSNSTQFFRSAREGKIEAVATALHVGRRTQSWEISMTQAGKLLAKTSLQTLVLEA